MKKYLIFTVALFWAFVSGAQQSRIRMANRYQEKLQYARAFEIWQDLSSDAEISKGLSEIDWRNAFLCAYHSEHYNEAIRFSKNLPFKSINRFQLSDLFIGCLIRAEARDSVAKYFLDSLSNYMGNARWGMIQEEKLDFVRLNKSTQGKFTISPMDNMGESENYGCFPLDTTSYYFVTDRFDDNFLHRLDGRSGHNYYSIAFSNYKNLDKPERWKEVDLYKFHAGPISFSPSGGKLFVTVNDEIKHKESKLKVHTLNLLHFYKSEQGWTPVTLPFNSENYSTGHGVLDTLGNLIFVSDMPGGLGGTDLFRSTYENGTWGAPVNLGPSVNSLGNEMFPFVSSAGILYFSSDGWQGLGGLDVFSYHTGDLTPVNLQAPLNSNSDDFAFWIDESKGSGYFSSNRVDSKDEIYQFNVPPFDVRFQVQALYCETKPIVSDTVSIKDLNSGYVHKLITNASGLCFFQGRENGAYEFTIQPSKWAAPVSKTFIVENQGNFDIELKPTLTDQTVVFEVRNERNLPIQGALLELFKKDGKKVKKKYLSDTKGVVKLNRSEIQGLDSLRISFINHSDFRWKNKTEDFCEDSLFVKVQLNKNSERDFINLDLILYDYDKFNLRPISKVELDKLVGYMKKHPDMKVELSSHTDCRGTAEYNERLSQNRSNSCVNYIISKGIDPSLIIAKGYGEYKLKNRCSDGVECSEEEHQQNRRTELHILLNGD
jgi:outer membrane protein OmpA-like peptidoglycan-associated protein